MSERPHDEAGRRVVRLPPADRVEARVPLGPAVRTHLLIGVAVALAGAGAWVSASDDTWGPLLAVELCALLLGGWLVVLLGSVLTRRGRLVVEQAPGRLALPGSRAVGGLLVGLLGLTLVVPLTLLAAWWSRGNLEGSALALGASVVLLPLGLPVVVQALRGRIRLPALVLDGAGVTYRGWRSDQSIDWSALADVRLVADPGRRLVLRTTGVPSRGSRSSTPGERTVGGPVVAADEVSVPAAFLGSDIALVADLVDACRTDAWRRAALGTDAALDGLGSRAR